MSQTLPQLFRQFNRPALPSHRPPILSAIATLLVAARSVYAASGTSRHQYDEKSLEPFREGLMDVLREGLRTEGLKSQAVRGSVALAEIPGYWKAEETEEIVRGMNDILIDDGDAEIRYDPSTLRGETADSNLRSTVLHRLTSISKVKSAVVETTTLPLLFHNLPDKAPSVSDMEAREKYRSILGSLSDLCIQPPLFETLVIRITTKLDLLSSATPSPSSDGDDPMPEADARECTIAYAWDLLDCLSGVIDAKIDLKHADVIRFFDQIIPRLNGLAIRAAAPRVGEVEPLFRDWRLLSIIGRISETLMWELSAEYVLPCVSYMTTLTNVIRFSGVKLGISPTCTPLSRRDNWRE